jgi:xanthine dehydrogenase YagS FAD-binding subunit
MVEFHRLPEDTPQIDTNLQPDELITAIDLPALPFVRHSLYRKVRDRASYAFALVSVAAALEVEDGKIVNARLALGGVAHKPWRAVAAEQVLVGATASIETFKAAAAAELKPARGYTYNAFKIELAGRTMVSVLQSLLAAGGAQ